MRSIAIRLATFFGGLWLVWGSIVFLIGATALLPEFRGMEFANWWIRVQVVWTFIGFNVLFFAGAFLMLGRTFWRKAANNGDS